MISPELAIQEALFARASTDPVLTQDLGAGVFDYVPEDELRPYVVVGEMFTTPDNAHGTLGWTTIAMFSIWSEHRGFREVHQIKDRLIELFDHKALVVAGFHHVETRFEFSQTFRDPDPKLRRALLRLHVATEQE